MDDTWIEPLTRALGDGFAVGVAALGVTIAVDQYLGGLMLAWSAALFTRNWWPENDRREFWVVLLSSALVSTLGAELFFAYFPNNKIPPQFVMALLGLFSRVIANLIMRVMVRLEERAPAIAARAVDRGLDRVLGPEKSGDD
jgi:hypothetical protein